MSKQHSAKTMFDQSIIYLYNSYIQQGMTPEQASFNVTKDIEDVFNRHLNRSNLVQKSSSILDNPVAKIDKLIKNLHPASRENLEGKRPRDIQSYYEGILRTATMDLNQLKKILEK